MTILCHGEAHVYLNNAPYCMCGAQVNVPPPHMAGYRGYRPAAVAPKPAEDVPLYVFRAAKSIDGATHLSADGKRVYVQMSDGVRVCFWDDESKRFGSSFPCDGLPNDAVKLDSEDLL